MEMKNVTIFLIIVWTILSVEYVTAEIPQQEARQIALHLTNNVSVEILPRLELLSGVLSQTSWMTKRGPRGKGNIYFQELQTLFEPYKNHEAIQLAERLTQQGFISDAPVKFMLRLSALPELEQRESYRDDLLQQVDNSEMLNQFRVALRNLSQEMKFLSFFEQRHSQLEHILQVAVEELDIPFSTSWIEDFYGTETSEFRLVFVPAMFYSGYGDVMTHKGAQVLYMILCEKGRSEHAPKFSTQSELSWMLTESSSFYLTQALFHPHLSFLQQQDLAELYAPVEPILSDSLVEYFTKTIAKSVWTLRNHSLSANEEELHPNAFFRDFVQGYYLTHFTVRQLQYYQRHRAEFPSFAEFLPYLLAQYVEHKASLLHEIFYGDGQWEYQKYKENTRSQDARIMLQLADNAYAEILPSLELLSGVLSQTSWIERRGPQGAGNPFGSSES
jgi:hypothetical protein